MTFDQELPKGQEENIRKFTATVPKKSTYDDEDPVSEILATDRVMAGAKGQTNSQAKVVGDLKNSYNGTEFSGHDSEFSDES